MRIISSLIAFAFIMVTLLGCSKPYTIRTKDGREYHAEGKPNVTNDKYIKFETKDGRKILLKQDEVSTIAEE